MQDFGVLCGNEPASLDKKSSRVLPQPDRQALPEPCIRPAQDSDSQGFMALIDACWSQYPGVLLDVDGEMPELHALATYYGNGGGALWTAEQDGRVVGMIATRPLENGAWEICRVYVLPDLHGSGLGHHLLDTAEAHARGAGAQRLVLWSDTRFGRAHRFYEKRSYIRSGPIRVLDDISNSLEFSYAKPVNGIERLDAAAAASAIPRLTGILTACVAEGGDLPFLPPLAPETARAFWQSIAKQVAAGTSCLLAAWSDGVLAGTVTLAFAQAQNQAHRAEVETLLVHPTVRRRGIGRTLMQRVEQEAAAASRSLLMVNTRAGQPAEALCRATGWHEAGRIPGFTLTTDGRPAEAVVFWKQTAASGAMPTRV